MGFAHDLGLETNFAELVVGQTTNVLAEILIFQPGAHVCRSAVMQQVFLTDAQLDRTSKTFSLLDASFGRSGSKMWLHQTETTKVIEHKICDGSAFRKMIEVCSGIGAVGQGFESAGTTTVCYCDHNAKFCEWLSQKHPHVPVIAGDIFSTDTLGSIANQVELPALVSGGFACQPFSGLGDRKEGQDPRSRSLPGLLRAIFFLRSPVGIAECTKEVQCSDWAQGLLHAFSSLTGYRIHQEVLHLSSVWPTSRTRWWAIISMPHLGITHFPPMPSLSFQPTVGHLFQLQKHLSTEEMDELILDLYETKHFHNAKGGIGAAIANLTQVFPTATHAWGTQLTPCHCGCRKGGFSIERLEHKGLYGALIQLGSMLAPPNDNLYEVRHPAPQEVALLNGLKPEYIERNKNFSFRFELGAVGQLASPLQGVWTLACALHQISSATDLIEKISPEVSLARLALEVIQSRFDVWPNQVPTEHTEAFVREFQLMSGDHSLVPQPFAEDIDRVSTEEVPSDSDGVTHILATVNQQGSHAPDPCTVLAVSTPKLAPACTVFPTRG